MTPRSWDSLPAILIACHDTGAANALSPVAHLLRNRGARVEILAVGQAPAVFAERGLCPLLSSGRDFTRQELAPVFASLGPLALLLGTSLESRSERDLCLLAQEQGIYCLAFVDWWSNFGRRFSTPGSQDLKFLPDEIAVIDKTAAEGCAAEGVPQDRLRITGNPYWDELIRLPARTLARVRSQVRGRMGLSDTEHFALILSSNIRNLDLGLGYDEKDFLKTVSPLPLQTPNGEPVRWAVKPHPKEKPAEIVSLLNQYKTGAVVMEDASAFEALAASDSVIGTCSSALFEAALLKKPVVSLQPGLNKEKMPFFRIFDQLGIPTLTQDDGVREMLIRLISREAPPPDTGRLPSPLGDGSAAAAIAGLLLQGARKFSENPSDRS